MQLFKISVKSTGSWDKTRKVYYVMQRNKEDAISYINQHIRTGFMIDKVFYLGYEMGTCLYGGGKGE